MIEQSVNQISGLKRRILKDGKWATKVRLWFSGITALHLFIVAVRLLLIDFSTVKPATLQVYHYRKWKLITTWCNLMMLPYYLISLYCDWSESHRAHHWHVGVLNKIRNTCFNCILVPTTFFTDTIFWRLWNKNPELLMPSEIHAYVPYWTQHSVHTVSLVVVIIDLLITPRKRPKSLKSGITIMYLFLAVYISMVFRNWLEGECIYPFLGQLTHLKLVCFTMLTCTEHLLFFSLQWVLVDFFWGSDTRSWNQKYV